MTSIMANHTKRTKVTTNCQCQTECCSLPTQIDVQGVVILPITMASHVLLKIPMQGMPQATPRLQCILIRTLLYNFTVRYILGLRNLLADCLSRLGDQNNTIKLPKLHVYQISHQLPARSDPLHELQQATQADDELALLKHTFMTGWPSTIKEILQVLQPYWTFHEELSIEDGLILKGTRIVVPNKHWETILHQIHDSIISMDKISNRHISF